MSSFDGLDRMNALLEALGHPEADFRAFHIAGTNGKGSTAVMIASVLEEAGYSVGLFTSPHLESECERIQIWDGRHRMIEQYKLDELREKVRGAFYDVKYTLHNEAGANDNNVKLTLHKYNNDDVKCTLHKTVEQNNSNVKATLHSEQDATNENVNFTLHERYGKLTVFETYTAAAYLYFQEQKPDYVVLEVGLGGKFDSTNTLGKPLVSIITQIGLDHTAILGDSIEEIATEKGGIIKPGVPIVSGCSDETARKVLREMAEERGAPFIDASSSEQAGSYKLLKLPKLAMPGEHQIRNARLAEIAIEAAGVEVSDEAMEIGLSEARLGGRIEITGDSPYLIIDGAHNPDAMQALIETYNEFAAEKNIKRTLVIFGCMQDKKSSCMIQLLSEGLADCEYALCAVDYDRAESPGKLAELFKAKGLEPKTFASVRSAYEYAKSADFDCVLVTGSIYLAGEIRSLLMKDKLTTK